MRLTRPLRASRVFLKDASGAAAAEFVIAAPVGVALLLAAIHMSFMMYAGATLHFAVEAAARCGAVSSSCGTTGATQTYAASRYYGPAASPTFTASLTATCSQVSATASYPLNIGIASYTLPINAAACYPRQPTA